MPLEAFSPTASVVGILTGGVTAVDRSLLLRQGTAQTRAAKSIQTNFSSRIDAALAKLNSAASTPLTDALRQDQAILTGRKERLNDSIDVVNKSVGQFQYLKNHVYYLRSQITALESGSINASALAEDWDNKLRKINQLILAADHAYKDGNQYYHKNLISAASRTSFRPQSFFAPYNSNGDTLLIGGVYLGVDYFLTETSPGTEFWNSDTARLTSEAATGTLTEYSSYPDTPSGNAEDVTTINFTGFTDNASGNDIVTFQRADLTNVTASITRGGLGLLDAWLYDDFQTSVDANAITRAKADLEAAEGLVLSTEADFKADLQALQSRSTLFDALIDGIEKEINQRLTDIQDDAEAELIALQLEFQVAQFGFALLASRGNTLIFSLVLAQDSRTGDLVGSTADLGEAIVGSTLNIRA